MSNLKNFSLSKHNYTPVVLSAGLVPTDNGHVPEALRLAHFIGSAVMTGESSNRA